MTVAPSGPDWWLWNKQHNNVPGSSAPQVNVVYRRLSTAVLALCNTPDGLEINLTFPDSCSCRRTLKFNFLPLSVCREAVELLLRSSPITVSLLVTLIQFPLLYHQIREVHEKLRLMTVFMLSLNGWVAATALLDCFESQGETTSFSTRCISNLWINLCFNYTESQSCFYPSWLELHPATKY